jgi:hypothetical protein
MFDVFNLEHGAYLEIGSWKFDGAKLIHRKISNPQFPNKFQSQIPKAEDWSGQSDASARPQDSRQSSSKPPLKTVPFKPDPFFFRPINFERQAVQRGRREP